MSEKPKTENRNVKRFMDGRMSPKDLHRILGWRGKKCQGCGSGNINILIRVLAELDELTKRQPNLVAGIAASNPAGPYVPTIATKYGPMVRLSEVAACPLCQKTAEVTAARGAPDWCIIEIDRGPEDIKTQVSVPL